MNMIQESFTHLFQANLLKKINSEFSFIEVWSPNKNSKPL